jgi:hypothetical protein
MCQPHIKLCLPHRNWASTTTNCPPPAPTRSPQIPSGLDQLCQGGVNFIRTGPFPTEDCAGVHQICASHARLWQSYQHCANPARTLPTPTRTVPIPPRLCQSNKDCANPTKPVANSPRLPKLIAIFPSPLRLCQRDRLFSNLLRTVPTSPGRSQPHLDCVNFTKTLPALPGLCLG